MRITPLSLLNHRNYQTYNRLIARNLGSIKASIMLAELVNRHEYHLERNELQKLEKHGEGWFYYTVDHCEERTYLSEKEQSASVKILEDRGLIEKKILGLPGKRHFRINEENILGLVGASKNVSSSDKKAELDPTKSQTSDRQNVGAIHIKEPNENPYKNNNPAEQDAPSAVVVSFDKLDLDEGQKRKLLKEHTPEELMHAIEQCLLWTGRKSDISALRYILDPKNKWEDKVSEEDVEQKNREYLKTLMPLDRRKIGHGGCMTISIGYRSFEVNSVNTSTILEANDPHLKINIETLLKKYGTSLEELKNLPK